MESDDDPLEIHPPIVHGEPTDADADACNAWHDVHRKQLAERYPTQFVSVTKHGVIAVGESREIVRQTVENLQWKHGRFWAYLSSPSDRNEPPRPTQSHQPWHPFFPLPRAIHDHPSFDELKTTYADPSSGLPSCSRCRETVLTLRDFAQLDLKRSQP